MAKTLPSRFNPDLMARDGARFHATVPLARFERLCAVLNSTEGEVHATAGFSRRKDHIVVSGRLSADFSLQCQRCVSPMILPIDEPYELVFVEDVVAAGALAEGLEPVVLDDTGQIRVIDLYEDELILHVPLIARHAQVADCAELPIEVGSFVVEDEPGAAKPKPFDVLRKLDLH